MHDSPGVVEKLLGSHLAWLFHDTIHWTCFGFCGAFLFGSRFVVQWLHSEKHQKIVVPPVFWHLSFWGSVINLIYAVHIDKLPLIVGAVFLPFIYGRNLVILRRDKSGVRSQTNKTPHMKHYTPLIALTLLGLALTGCSKYSPTASLPKDNDLGVVDVSIGKPSSHTLADGRACTITPTVLPGGDVSLSTKIDGANAVMILLAKVIDRHALRISAIREVRN